MQPVEFDKFADEYIKLHKKNIKISGETPEFFTEYKIKDVIELSKRYGINPEAIMDFGAGVCCSTPYFVENFPNASLTCLDVSNKSLSIGRDKFHGLAQFHIFDGKNIPFDNNSFDIVFAACVFHHIPHIEHIQILKEWHRVLKPKGIAIIFEHNPFNPFTLHAVNTCPFDENAVLVKAKNLKQSLSKAGFLQIELCYRLFFPHFLSRLRPLEKFLKNCPLGAQYFSYGLKADN